MPVIGLRDLSRKTAEVVKELQSNGEPVIITKQGKPIATLTAVDETEAQNLVLSLAPDIRETSSTTEVEASPRKVRSLGEVDEQLAREASLSSEGRKALAEMGGELAQQRAELSGEVDRLVAEAPARLSGVEPALVVAWRHSTQRLMEGAVQAALESARSLQERVVVTGKPTVGTRTRAKAKARSSATVQLTEGKARARRKTGISKAAAKRKQGAAPSKSS